MKQFSSRNCHFSGVKLSITFTYFLITIGKYKLNGNGHASLTQLKKFFLPFFGVFTKFWVKVYIKIKNRLKNNSMEWMSWLSCIRTPWRQHLLPTNQQKGHIFHCEQHVTMHIFSGQHDLQIRHPDRARLSHFISSDKQDLVRI